MNITRDGVTIKHEGEKVKVHRQHPRRFIGKPLCLMRKEGEVVSLNIFETVTCILCKTIADQEEKRRTGPVANYVNEKYLGYSETFPNRASTRHQHEAFG